jgi:DNA-binding ferritin-like protein
MRKMAAAPGAFRLSDRCRNDSFPTEISMADINPALNTPTDLSNTRSVADALNSSLADCYALYLKTKNFHWHVSGPHFRDYHLLLDDQAAQILGVTDAIAERVRKTGNTTLRSIGDISRRQTIADNDLDFVDAGAMLAARGQSQAGRKLPRREGRRRRGKGQCHQRHRRRMDRSGRGTRLVPVRGQPQGLNRYRISYHLDPTVTPDSFRGPPDRRSNKPLFGGPVDAGTSPG